ncbi:50S ribosomal protein L20 [Candidatus Gottesmanbacteria bacterium]|nr:50S ribosomal protein L20 [Candidatus Gottesmanbacteria bacterium]
MARIKRGITSRRKHNKLFQSVKGYRMTKRRLVKVAKEAALHAGAYAYAGRRLKKRDFRSLWITRISGALKEMDLSYSKFINLLKVKKIQLDRKILSDLVVNDPKTFKSIVDKIKAS